MKEKCSLVTVVFQRKLRCWGNCASLRWSNTMHVVTE